MILFTITITCSHAFFAASSLSIFDLDLRVIIEGADYSLSSFFFDCFLFGGVFSFASLIVTLFFLLGALFIADLTTFGTSIFSCIRFGILSQNAYSSATPALYASLYPSFLLSSSYSCIGQSLSILSSSVYISTFASSLASSGFLSQKSKNLDTFSLTFTCS